MPVGSELDEIAEARQVVSDAMSVLTWCADPGARLLDDDGEDAPVLPDELRASYAEAVDELWRDHWPLAESAFDGDSAQVNLDQVREILGAAGWTGSLLEFKLGVLDFRGRGEVMAVVRRAQGGGSIPRLVLKGFLGVLNAALESLKGIPAVAAIKEVKDFVDGVIG